MVAQEALGKEAAAADHGKRSGVIHSLEEGAVAEAVEAAQESGGKEGALA